MTESLSAFSGCSRYSSKVLHQTASLVFAMFASHCVYSCAVTGIYEHHSEKCKAEHALEDYKKNSFPSMSGFLPYAL